MSDCANSRCEPYRRVEVRVIFADRREHDYLLPINLMNRTIDHFDVDGERFVRARPHEESWEWMNERDD